MGQRIRKRPRPGLWALLQVASFEVLAAREEPGRIPKVIDHAVGQTKIGFSQGESKLVNAVLRQFLETVETFEKQADLEKVSDLAVTFSHPEWLVRRWVDAWGVSATRALLAWNQQPPESTLALRTPPPEAQTSGLEATGTAGFYRIRDGLGWKSAEHYLSTGQGYIQDPATALGPAAAGLEPGQRVLDLCSAPGGKAWQLLACEPEELVSVDRGPEALGSRYTQWLENLSRFPGKVVRVECELGKESLEATLRASGVDPSFDRVFIDVPCSNTGVIRRRPEVRWRLEPATFSRMASTQVALLESSAARVSPGGRLVYSTCSLEPEENREVAEQFEKSHPAFRALTSAVFFPPASAHDGAGVFSWEKATGT